MKPHLLIISILLIASSAFAGPKYDAVYHLISKSYVVNEDGSMDYHFRKELQLFTSAAFDAYGETLITYNTELQTLTVNEAYTVRKDGSVVQTPKNAFNPSLPYGCTNCERFNVIREMVVTHTALEYDATIVLDYTIHSTQPFMQELMERVDLYEDAPVEKYEVSVSFPHFLTLNSFVNYHGKNMTQTKTEKADSMVVMQWTFTNLPQKPHDAYLPSDYLPYMLLTTASSPSYFMEELSYQNAFLDAPADLFKETLPQILLGKNTNMEKMLAIRDYVADNVHTNTLPIRYMNYIMASPYTIWQTNCATAFEKNLLLKSMLNAAGIGSMFGIFYNKMMSDPESALRVIVDGKMFFVTAASKHQLSLEKTMTPDSFLAMSGDVYKFVSEPINIDVDVNVDMVRTPEGVSGTVNVNRENVGAAGNERMLPKEQKPVSVVPRPLSGKYSAFKLVDSPYGCNLKASNISRTRTAPLEVTPCSETYIYHVTLPIDVDCVTKPYSIEKTYDFGSVKMNMEVQGDKVTVTRQLNINVRHFTDKKQIRQLREMIGEWNAEREIVVAKNNKPHEIPAIYDL